MNEYTEQKTNVPTTTTGTTPPADLMSVFLNNIMPIPCVRTALEKEIDLLKTKETKSIDDDLELAALEATLATYLLQTVRSAPDLTEPHDA